MKYALFILVRGFPTKYQGNDEGEYAFYKVSDIANNVQLGNTYLSVCNNYISGEIAKEIKGCILPKDTVVFAKNWRSSQTEYEGLLPVQIA